MLALLNEYISEQGTENEYNPHALLDELKANDIRELNDPKNKSGKANPYRELLEDFTRRFLLEEHHGKQRTILCYGAPNSGKT